MQEKLNILEKEVDMQSLKTNEHAYTRTKWSTSKASATCGTLEDAIESRIHEAKA